MEEACSPLGADCIHFTPYDRFVLDNEPLDFSWLFGDFASLGIVSETYYSKLNLLTRLIDDDQIPSQEKKLTAT